MLRNCCIAMVVLALPGLSAMGQSSQPDMKMPEMSMPGIEDSSDSLINVFEQHLSSGTDVEPISTPREMLMGKKGAWMFMFHGTVFLNEIQENGPRGGDKFFSTNWFMPMAQRKLGGTSVLSLRTMLSLEPATVSERRYPELLQQGETAYGRPIVDGQHPHNLFMEIAAIYDRSLGEKTALTIYAAPVGDPALGPTAYPHRASASENPLAPLGHHLEDSTHIADDVVTLGITHRKFRIEASGFHGREPDEYRWDIDAGKIDSWSARISLNPGRNWSLQYSIGQLHSPEALQPNEDVRRMTASISYNRPIRNGNWASLLLWGRNQSLADGNVGNGYLFESTLQFARRNSLWTRVENVDRTNELLLGENPLPAAFSERYFARVEAYTAGYDREILNLPHLSAALGAQFTGYGIPAQFEPTYGSHPAGIVAFLRLRTH
jgi:hypothetical protein